MDKKSSATSLENPGHIEDKAATNIDFTAVEKQFSLKEPEQIFRFLTSHPYLIPLLSETAEVVERYFSDVKFGLHYYVDPEVASFKWLTMQIPTKYSPEEASYRLNKFDEEWWLDNEYRTNGNLTVNVEFV